MVSVSYGGDLLKHAGLENRGHRLSRHELNIEQRESVASLTSSEEMVLRGVEQRQPLRKSGSETGCGGCGGTRLRGLFREAKNGANEIMFRDVQRHHH